jgi:hypothetical protein
MTFAEIRARVDACVNRLDQDYLANRDECIRAGHRYVERKFLGREVMFERWTTSDQIPAGVGTVPLSACYRASAELRVYLLPDRVPLTRIRTPWLREPFTSEDALRIDLRNMNTLGTPTYFAVQGRTVLIRPLPAEPIDLEIVGTGWAEPLMGDLDETVVSQEAPDALIYASCAEVWKLLGDEPQMTYWQTQADKAIGEWMADRLHEEEPPVLYMEVPG